MAKLNGITVLGEVITREGRQYAASTETAVAGDIVRAKTRLTDINVDDYYMLKTEDGELYFVDNGGDRRAVDNVDSWVTNGTLKLYKPLKTSAASTPTLTEVKRHALVGETIKIISRESDERRYENGDQFIVTKVDYDGDAYITASSGSTAMVCYFEYVVLEPAAAPEIVLPPQRLQVGQYVKVVSDTSRHDGRGTKRVGITVGEIRKLIRDDHDNVPFHAETLDGATRNFFHEPSLVLATEDEVYAAKRALFPVGSKVTLVSGGGEFPLIGFTNNATYVVLDNNHPHSASTRVQLVGGSRGIGRGYATPSQLTLVAESTPTQHICQIGDTVRLTIAEGKQPRFGYGNGGVKNGDIGVIRRWDSDGDLRVDFPKQRDWTGLVTEFTLVTPAITESAKWSSIGRQIGEIKAGDIVKVVKDTCGHPVGTIGVSRGNGFVIANGRSYSHNAAELVAPVESVFANSAK